MHAKNCENRLMKVKGRSKTKVVNFLHHGLESNAIVMLQTSMHTAAKGIVCGVTDADLGAVTTEPTRIPATAAGLGCCTTLPTGCAATETPSWTDEDVVGCGSADTGAADKGSTGGRTDIGGGGRTPSMCILFMLKECRSSGKLFCNNTSEQKFTTTLTNISALRQACTGTTYNN